MKKKISILSLLGTLLFVVGIVSAQNIFPDSGTSTANFLIQNMDLGSNATVSVSFYNESGVIEYTDSSINLNPKAVEVVRTADQPVPAGFRGSAIVSSDQPIGVVGLIRNTNVPAAADGTTQAAYNGFSAGSDTLYFPTFFAFDFLVTSFSVQNTEDTSVNIDIDYYDRTGAFIGTVSDTLPANGSKTYCGCDPTDWPNGTIPNGFQAGSITVTSTGGEGLAGAAVTSWNDRSAAYQALTNADQGTNLYMPSHFRFKTNPANALYTISSAITVQNPDATEDAEIEIRYYNRATGLLDLTLNATIPPLSSIGANTKNGGNFSPNVFNVLGTGWSGSVQVVSVPNGNAVTVPVVGTGTTNWDISSQSGIHVMPSINSAAEEIFLPAQFRLDFGLNGWDQWSSINLQNVGGSPVDANNLTIEYVDEAGNTVATFSGADFGLPSNQLASGAALGLNTRNGGDVPSSSFNSFGFQYIGGIYVSGPAGSELIATANIAYSNRASVYNGIPGN